MNSGLPEVVVVHEVLRQAVQVTALGPQGPRGLDGGAGLGGIPAQIQSIQTGDVLMYDGTFWTNENKSKISDGGNF